jgi:hypothetical protein
MFPFQVFFLFFYLVAAVVADMLNGHAHAQATGPLCVGEPKVVRGWFVSPVAPVAAAATTYRSAPVNGKAKSIDSPAYNVGYRVKGDAYPESAKFAHSKNQGGYRKAGAYRIAPHYERYYDPSHNFALITPQLS